jgi:hypothetical protein
VGNCNMYGLITSSSTGTGTSIFRASSSCSAVTTGASTPVTAPNNHSSLAYRRLAATLTSQTKNNTRGSKCPPAGAIEASHLIHTDEAAHVELCYSSTWSVSEVEGNDARQKGNKSRSSPEPQFSTPCLVGVSPATPHCKSPSLITSMPHSALSSPDPTLVSAMKDLNQERDRIPALRCCVGFSDGEWDGPIRGLNPKGHKSDDDVVSLATITSEQHARVSFVRSARSERIADMMQNLKSRIGLPPGEPPVQTTTPCSSVCSYCGTWSVSEVGVNDARQKTNNFGLLPESQDPSPRLVVTPECKSTSRIIPRSTPKSPGVPLVSAMKDPNRKRYRPRRFVSFSDGEWEGPIRGLNPKHHKNGNEVASRAASISKQDPVRGSFIPSTWFRRIVETMQKLKSRICLSARTSKPAASGESLIQATTPRAIQARDVQCPFIAITALQCDVDVQDSGAKSLKVPLAIQKGFLPTPSSQVPQDVIHASTSRRRAPRQSCHDSPRTEHTHLLRDCDEGTPSSYDASIRALAACLRRASCA